MAEDRDWRARVRLEAEDIPEVRAPLPVMALGEGVLAPHPLLEKIIGSVAADARLADVGATGALAAYAGARLVAFVNPKTGESRIVPGLVGLPPCEDLAERSMAAAADFCRDTSLFPEDGTRLIAQRPRILMGSHRSREGTRTDAAAYLAFVPMRRYVGDTPVFGPGSRAMIAVAGDGSIRGLTHRWRAAQDTDRRVAPHKREEIAEAISSQLRPFTTNSHVTVDRIVLGYYDGGGDFLHPVYRFHATVASDRKKLAVTNRHVLGFVSIGDAPERLPVAGVHRGPTPHEPPQSASGSAASVPPGDPTVGRYVVRNDDAGWVNSANNFWDALEEAQNFWGGPLSFTDSQYYWAEPFEYVSNKDQFVNSVHIALTESHGNWDVFSTRDNHDDIVHLSDIPSTGYGGFGGGSLAYWIIHSCEVIPTATDETTSFDVWWNIFNGLHATMGYRTEMWINDGATTDFGLFVGLGAPVVPQWLSAVATDDAYDDGDMYHDGNRNMDEPMGRPSAICVCGHEDDTAGDVAPLAAPTCLSEYWIDN